MNQLPLPLLPTPESAQVFTTLRKAPWLSLDEPNQWRARADRELDATNQKSLMDFSAELPEGFWKVYKGASFDLWNLIPGNTMLLLDPSIVLPWLQEKRVKGNSGKRDSVHKEFSSEYVSDKETLAPLRARIAFHVIFQELQTVAQFGVR